MTKTQNYKLNQWEKSDQVLMDDFNADNAAIDGALTGLDAKIAAAKSDLDGKIATKAEQTALAALTATVAGHTTALAGKGNCSIETGSYVGDGTERTITITASFKPKVIIVWGSFVSLMFQGTQSAKHIISNIQHTLNLVWSGNSVSWKTDRGYHDAYLNSPYFTYYYVVLG